MKLNILYSTLIAFISSVFIFSCSKHESTISPQISLSGEKSHIVAAVGKELLITVNVNKEWSVKSDQTWCKVTPTGEKEGTHNVTIKIAENTTGEERTAKIIFTCETISEYVTITQEMNDVLTISQGEYIVPSNGGQVSIKVESNIKYSFVIPENVTWIKEAATKAIAEYIHSFDVEPNENYDSRSCFIIINDETNSLSDTITVTQLQKDVILVAKDEYTIESKGGTLDLDVSTNVALDVKTTEEWIKYNPSTKGLNDLKIHFSIDENKEYKQREGKIIIYKDSLQQEIKVIQSPRPQSLRINHNNVEYTIPDVTGNNITGKIYWGDGEESDYIEGSKHNYSSSNEHTVTIKLHNATKVYLPNILGIKELDFSDF